LIINGVDYTNGWFNNIQADENGEYLIEYSSSVAWGHFEANPPAVTRSSQNNGSSFGQNEMASLFESEVDPTDLRNGVEPSVKVYPIPAREELFLQMNDFLGKDVNITLINRLGQTMRMLELDNLEDSTLNIPLDELDNGLYYIRLIIDQKDSINKSFIIQK